MSAGLGGRFGEQRHSRALRTRCPNSVPRERQEQGRKSRKEREGDLDLGRNRGCSPGQKRGVGGRGGVGEEGEEGEGQAMRKRRGKERMGKGRKEQRSGREGRTFSFLFK